MFGLGDAIGIHVHLEAQKCQLHALGSEICEHVGATSLHYLTLDGLQASTGRPESQFCRACFSGEYPIPVPEELAMCKMRFEKGNAPCQP